MNPDWQNFLAAQGAQIDASGNSTFLDSGTADDALTLMDLSFLGLIQASGEETREFLQGQLSNDIEQVQAGQSQLSSYCSPKGRVMTTLQVFSHQDELYLQLPLDLQEHIQKRLGIFIMRAKTHLSDASNTLMRIGLAGRDAENTLIQAGLALPDKALGVSQHEQISVLRLPDATPRFELFADQETLQKLWQTLAKTARLSNSVLWQHLNILAGLPSISPSTQEAFVPQMINLHSLGGVNFQKGCYPGQEVVARMKYLGKLKRRMYLASVSLNEAPQAGDKLFSDKNTSGQGTGKVVNCQPSAQGTYDLLCVLDINSAENESIHLQQADGPILQLHKLPYPIEA